MRKKLIMFLVMFIALINVSLFAQRTTDIEGSKDYPLVSRFEGAVIQWYQHKNFDRYYLLNLKDNTLKPKEIEGNITRIQYSAGKEHSIFEILKSYESALKNAGFNILLSLNETNGPSNLNEQLYFDEFNGLNRLPRGSVKPDHDGKWSYLEAAGQKHGKDIYIIIYFTNYGWPLITFDAVEVKKMDTGLVSAKSIDKGISSSGHTALDGIYFDTGESTIKFESDAALKNISEYLKMHADKKFLIVGHTDNAGNFDANLKLSYERAKAVVAELIAKYSVKNDQLKPYGVGSASPVASNSSDKGRAKNRRVEIVEQ